MASSTANAQWTPDVQLSPDGTPAGLNENMGQCILTNGDTVHVVWMDTKIKEQAVYYKRSIDKGVTWSADTRISGPAGGDTMPLLAQSGSTLHLVFLRNNNTTESASYYKRSTDGGRSWGPDVLLGKTKWWPGVAAAGSNVYVSLNSVYADDAKNSVVYFRRSTDNGATWEAQQPISTSAKRTGGRSEDPAIVADGKYVHLVWNDNRDATPGKGMSVYYRRSSDMGATWGPETALTHAPDYTYCPTLSLNGSNVDVAFANRGGGQYDIFRLHSADFGTTWGEKEQITKNSGGTIYPAILRDGSNLHLAWTGKGGLMYQHSSNGGTTWDAPITLSGSGGIPFMAVSGETLHLLFAPQRDGHGVIEYKRNPTGNK